MLIISKDYQWKSAKVTLHSQHPSLTPSKQRSQFHALAGQHLRYVRSALFLWWLQQSSGQPFLLPLRVLPLLATAHTIDGRIIKSYFVTYIYTLFSLWLF